MVIVSHWECECLCLPLNLILGETPPLVWRGRGLPYMVLMAKRLSNWWRHQQLIGVVMTVSGSSAGPPSRSQRLEVTGGGVVDYWGCERPATLVLGAKAHFSWCPIV